MATQTRSRTAVSTEDQLARRISDRIDSEAQAIGEAMGPPSGSDRYTQRELDTLWDTPDHTLDPQALFQALQQGITPEGAQAVALFRMSPDLAKFVTGKPLPADQAAALAQLAQYPGQYVMTAGHSADPTLQVRFVADQQQRAARRGAVQAPPAPAQAPMSTTTVVAAPPAPESGGYQP